MAVVVAGAGVAVVATAVAAVLRAEGFAEGLTRATSHLDLVLTRLESGELPLEDAAGDFSEEGAPDLKWSVVIDNTDIEGLRAVECTVLWPLHGEDRELSVVRLMYVHVPSAVACYLGCLVTTVASGMWLRRRSPGWDVLAGAGAELGLVFVLITLAVDILYTVVDPRIRY